MATEHTHNGLPETPALDNALRNYQASHNITSDTLSLYQYQNFLFTISGRNWEVFLEAIQSNTPGIYQRNAIGDSPFHSCLLSAFKKTPLDEMDRNLLTAIIDTTIYGKKDGIKPRGSEIELLTRAQKKHTLYPDDIFSDLLAKNQDTFLEKYPNSLSALAIQQELRAQTHNTSADSTEAQRNTETTWADRFLSCLPIKKDDISR